MIPGGSGIELTYDKLDFFIERCIEVISYCHTVLSSHAQLQVRLSEADKQISAIKQGLATVVPIDLLQLWSWDDLEFAVTGNRTMDVELLKKHTTINKNHNNATAVVVCIACLSTTTSSH